MPNWIISKNWQKLSEFFPKKLQALAYFKSKLCMYFRQRPYFCRNWKHHIGKVQIKENLAEKCSCSTRSKSILKYNFFNSQKYLRETKERGLFPLPKTVSIFRFFDKYYQCACSFVTHAHLIQLKSWLKLLPVKLSHNILVRFQLGWSGAR